MKFALVSDLHVDHYPGNQQLDWLVVRTWTGTDTLVIVGNVSDSLHRTMQEILMARRAFQSVIFVEGPCEYHSGHSAPQAVEQLQHFAERHEGVYYLGNGPGVVINHTLVCGIAIRHHLYTGADCGMPEQGRPHRRGRSDAASLELCRAVLPDTLSAHHFMPLAQRVRDAAVDQSIHEIMIVTHMAPHAGTPMFSDDPIRDLKAEAACTAALAPIWSDCLDGGKLTTWCFGHSRLYQDFTDKGVRFISNPRGYWRNNGDTPYTVRVVDTSSVTEESFEGHRQVGGG
jgi:hypothetical protein